MLYERQKRLRQLRNEPGALPRLLFKSALSHRRPGFGQLIGKWGNKPDFLIIGTQKGGTTSLYSFLTLHPQVRAAATKEIHYFDFYYPCTEAWYRAHFPRVGRESGIMTGEASPGYLFNPYAAARAAAFSESLKLIVMLRDPVERAISHYSMSLRREREHLPFAAALELEAERLWAERRELGHERAFAEGISHRNHSYLARGHYAEQLTTWLEHFPREQLLVIESERFFDEPARVYAETLEFLELPVKPLRQYRNSNGYGRVDLEPELREKLTTYFRPHNTRLEALLGRPLWQYA